MKRIHTQKNLGCTLTSSIYSCNKSHRVQNQQPMDVAPHNGLKINFVMMTTIMLIVTMMEELVATIQRPGETAFVQNVSA